MSNSNGIPLSFDVANGMVAELGVLKFFPSDDAAGLAIVRLVASMCNYEHQLRWLIDRMTNGSVFSEWPGPREFRAVYCAKYKPKDGIEATSLVYLDGIPSEKESMPMLAPQTAPPDRQLPAAEVEKAKIEAEKVLAEAMETVKMPAPMRLTGEAKQVDRELRRLVRELPELVPPTMRITPEDIEAARQEYERKKAEALAPATEEAKV